MLGSPSWSCSPVSTAPPSGATISTSGRTVSTKMRTSALSATWPAASLTWARSRKAPSPSSDSGKQTWPSWTVAFPRRSSLISRVAVWPSSTLTVLTHTAMCASGSLAPSTTPSSRMKGCVPTTVTRTGSESTGSSPPERARR